MYLYRCLLINTISERKNTRSVLPPPCHEYNLNKEKARQIMFPSVRNEVKSLASEGMKEKQIFQKLCTKTGGFSKTRVPTGIANFIEKNIYE